MQRREFVYAIVSSCLAPRLLSGQQAQGPAPPPPAPVPWTLGLNANTPLPQTDVGEDLAGTDPVFFSTVQMVTLTRLSGVLLPSIGNKPGALQAGTPSFLDFLIGSSPDSRRKLYTGGLDWLDASSRKEFGMGFAEISASQADALVKPWMRTWMTDHPPTESHADFLNIAHADIRTATMNSKAWADATNAERDPSSRGLYWSPIDPDIYADDFRNVHMRPSPMIAPPKSSHVTPSYPR